VYREESFRSSNQLIQAPFSGGSVLRREGPVGALHLLRRILGFSFERHDGRVPDTILAADG